MGKLDDIFIGGVVASCTAYITTIAIMNYQLSNSDFGSFQYSSIINNFDKVSGIETITACAFIGLFLGKQVYNEIRRKKSLEND